MIEEIISSKAVLSQISKLSIFSTLDESEFGHIKDFLTLIHIRKDEYIFKEGDEGEDMFIHFSGDLNAYAAQKDGTQRLLFKINKDEFFGEMSIITHEPRSVSIIAENDTVSVKLSGEDFYHIITEYPLIGYKILRTISVVQNSWLDSSSKSFNDLTRWGETARKRAVTDEMTGLYNSNFLKETINERFNNQSMNFRIMSLLMLDLDKIHGINDKYGTKAGDLVICAAADVIRSCLRSGDIASRLSGDEFAILLPDTDIKDAYLIAERIRELIEKKQIEVPAGAGSSETVFISTRTSIGIAVAPAHANTTESLEEASDAALRKAKEAGRNRVEVFK